MDSAGIITSSYRASSSAAMDIAFATILCRLVAFIRLAPRTAAMGYAETSLMSTLVTPGEITVGATSVYKAQFLLPRDSRTVRYRTLYPFAFDFGCLNSINPRCRYTSLNMGY